MFPSQRRPFSARMVRSVALAALATMALMGLTPASAQTVSEATRVRILLVIDTHGDKGENLGLDLDGANMEKLLDSVLAQQGLQNRYTLDILRGPGATPQKVLAYYRNLKTNPNEALLFYFSGHGAVDPKHGHFMVLNGQPLLRSEVRKAMARHNPRLLVLLTDACADIIGREPAKQTPQTVKGPSLKAQGRGEALRHLLFRSRGVVDISAAAVGTYAKGSRQRGGSYFTIALVALLGEAVAQFDRNGDGVVQWSEFYALLHRQTQVVARGVQVPQAFQIPPVSQG